MNRTGVVVLALVVGAGLGITLALIAPAPTAKQNIEWLDSPRPLERFTLNTESGEFDNQSLQGRWTFVLFGFLQCPDVCPTSVSQLGALARALTADSNGGELNFVFVSVDPGRDSVADVDQYARHFDPSIKGVTGSEEQLTRLARSLGTQFKVSAGDNYRVAHSITFSIIDPQGVFRARFRPGFDVADLVSSFRSKLND